MTVDAQPSMPPRSRSVDLNTNLDEYRSSPTYGPQRPVGRRTSTREPRAARPAALPGHVACPASGHGLTQQTSHPPRSRLGHPENDARSPPAHRRHCHPAVPQHRLHPPDPDNNGHHDVHELRNIRPRRPTHPPRRRLRPPIPATSSAPSTGSDVRTHPDPRKGLHVDAVRQAKPADDAGASSVTCHAFVRATTSYSTAE